MTSAGFLENLRNQTLRAYFLFALGLKALDAMSATRRSTKVPICNKITVVDSNFGSMQPSLVDSTLSVEVEANDITGEKINRMVRDHKT